MPQDSTKQESPRWDSAILITIGTAFAYLAAFRFEAGYIGHFGVPVSFTEVDIRDLLIAGGVLSVVVITIGNFADLLYSIWLQRLPPRVRRRVILLLLMVIGFLVFDFLALVPWYLWLISLALPFLIALQYLILPLIPRGDGTSYMQRVESTVSRKSDPALGAGFYALGERIGQRTVGLLFATILLFSFAYSIGDFVARAQSEFLVDTWEPCAVIRFSSTELLCVEYDAATHKALPSYRLLETHTRLSLRRVGPFPRVESPPSQ